MCSRVSDSILTRAQSRNIVPYHNCLPLAPVFHIIPPVSPMLPVPASVSVTRRALSIFAGALALVPSIIQAQQPWQVTTSPTTTPDGTRYQQTQHVDIDATTIRVMLSGSPNVWAGTGNREVIEARAPRSQIELTGPGQSNGRTTADSKSVFLTCRGGGQCAQTIYVGANMSAQPRGGIALVFATPELAQQAYQGLRAILGGAAAPAEEPIATDDWVEDQGLGTPYIMVRNSSKRPIRVTARVFNVRCGLAQVGGGDRILPGGIAAIAYINPFGCDNERPSFEYRYWAEYVP